MRAAHEKHYYHFFTHTEDWLFTEDYIHTTHMKGDMKNCTHNKHTHSLTHSHSHTQSHTLTHSYTHTHTHSLTHTRDETRGESRKERMTQWTQTHQCRTHRPHIHGRHVESSAALCICKGRIALFVEDEAHTPRVAGRARGIQGRPGLLIAGAECRVLLPLKVLSVGKSFISTETKLTTSAYVVKWQLRHNVT